VWCVCVVYACAIYQSAISKPTPNNRKPVSYTSQLQILSLFWAYKIRLQRTRYTLLHITRCIARVTHCYTLHIALHMLDIVTHCTLRCTHYTLLHIARCVARVTHCVMHCTHYTLLHITHCVAHVRHCYTLHVALHALHIATHYTLRCTHCKLHYSCAKTLMFYYAIKVSPMALKVPTLSLHRSQDWSMTSAINDKSSSHR